MKDKYYIFKKDLNLERSYLVGPKAFSGQKKFRYDQLTLMTFIGKDVEFNVLYKKLEWDALCEYSNSSKLTAILKEKGVNHEIFTIESSEENNTVFNLGNDMILKVVKEYEEQLEFWSWGLFNKASNNSLVSKFVTFLSIDEIINHKIVFSFEGEAKEDGTVPDEVKKYMRHSKQTTRNTIGKGIGGCLLGGILMIVLMIIIYNFI